jgi:hypothetical protein
MKWLRVLNAIGMVMEKVNTPLLVAGFLLSLLTAVIEPWTANFIILGVYIVLIFIKFIIGFLVGHSWGMVVDEETGKPIELAVVRIYDANSGNVMGTRVTNQLGQFTSFIMPGEYYIVILKDRYEPFRSKPITVTKRRGLIRMKAQLIPKDKIKELPEGEEIISLESVDYPKRAKPISSTGASGSESGYSDEEMGQTSSGAKPGLNKSVFKPPPLITVQKRKRLR